MKKAPKTFMILSIVFALLAAAFFGVSFLFAQEGVKLLAFPDTLINGLTSIINRFSFGLGLTDYIFVGLLGLFGLLWLVYFIVICAKRKGKSVGGFIVALLMTAIVLVISNILFFNPGSADAPYYSRPLVMTFLDEAFGSKTEGFPWLIAVSTTGAAGLSALAYFFIIMQMLTDFGGKRVKKQYADGASKDDANDEAELVSAEEIAEELEEKEEPVQEEPKQEPQPAAAPAPAPAPVAQQQPVIIQQYLGQGNGEAAVKADEIRKIVKEELEQKQTVGAEEVRQIIREELERLLASGLLVAAAAKTAEAVAEEPAEEEPEEQPAEEQQPEPEVIPVPVPVEVPEEPKAKIVRIPFSQRIENMSDEQKEHFNELKAEIMAYGVKSRVSNSGDTFRLHTKTYVKMVIAGKGLKLYLAVDPAKYADSTIPFNDVGHKGIYKDIPFAFKVKSELSMRRAKELIAEAMASGNLVKGEVVKKDYIQELIDSKVEPEDDGAEEAED